MEADGEKVDVLGRLNLNNVRQRGTVRGSLWLAGATVNRAMPRSINF